jgi:hypothetical protein
MECVSSRAASRDRAQIIPAFLAPAYLADECRLPNSFRHSPTLFAHPLVGIATADEFEKDQIFPAVIGIQMAGTLVA